MERGAGRGLWRVWRNKWISIFSGASAWVSTMARAGLSLAIGLWGDPEVTRLIDARPKLSDDDVKELLGNKSLPSGNLESSIGQSSLEGGDHVGCCGILPYDLPRRIYELGVHIRSRTGGVDWRKKQRRQ